MLYIGVDLGTSAVKLLLMDGEGKILNIVSREYPLSFPHPGWSEQDPADWLRATVDGIRALTKGFDKNAIAGIGCGGQMHGLVVLDEDDRVLRPAILWNDGRTAEETDWLNNEIGKARLSELTANIAFAGFTAPKLLWMRKHEPELFARIRRIMLPMKEGNPFSDTVSKDIRRTGWAVVVMGVIANLVTMLEVMAEWHMWGQKAAEGMFVRSVTVNYTFDAGFLVIFAILMLTAWIFEYGAELQKLSDETL